MLLISVVQPYQLIQGISCPEIPSVYVAASVSFTKFPPHVLKDKTKTNTTETC